MTKHRRVIFNFIDLCASYAKRVKDLRRRQAGCTTIWKRRTRRQRDDNLQNLLTIPSFGSLNYRKQEERIIVTRFSKILDFAP